MDAGCMSLLMLLPTFIFLFFFFPFFGCFVYQNLLSIFLGVLVGMGKGKGKLLRRKDDKMVALVTIYTPALTVEYVYVHVHTLLVLRVHIRILSIHIIGSSLDKNGIFFTSLCQHST